MWTDDRSSKILHGGHSERSEDCMVEVAMLRLGPEPLLRMTSGMIAVADGRGPALSLSKGRPLLAD